MLLERKKTKFTYNKEADYYVKLIEWTYMADIPEEDSIKDLSEVLITKFIVTYYGICYYCNVLLLIRNL